ncbi:hypothetical protein [Gottfriedia acidiceleris]|uniref:hypothetical protein n=1 Tax=Gottfriedia acidiceleris TaxID=371036 RepID=UPI000B442CED|nr:hypothetical protein [Gottfriedia acidiceleris]
MRQTTWKEIILMFGPVILFPIILFFVLHTSPSIALRTYIFFNGHPILAIKSEIVDDKEHNQGDRGYLRKEHAKCYSLNEENYILRKKGFIYLADYYGNA